MPAYDDKGNPVLLKRLEQIEVGSLNVHGPITYFGISDEFVKCGKTQVRMIVVSVVNKIALESSQHAGLRLVIAGEAEEQSG
jgi:hypothetical protein